MYQQRTGYSYGVRDAVKSLSLTMMLFLGLINGALSDQGRLTTYMAQGEASEIEYILAGNMSLHVPKREKYQKRKNRGEKNIRESLTKNFPKWRAKSELAKILQQASQYNGYLKQNKILREGLIAHENKHNHTIVRHVGVSMKSLLARAEHEKKQGAKREGKDKVDHNDLEMEAISSFRGLREADRLVDRVLSDKSNQHILKNWVAEHFRLQRRKQNGEKINLNHEKYGKDIQNLTLNIGKSTGVAIDPKTKKIIETTGVEVRLKLDKSNPRGWSIVTAFPIP